MRTITPEEVEAAFKETEYQPASYLFLSIEKKQACAIGILGLITGCEQDQILKWVSDNFDCRYEMGVTLGFKGYAKLGEQILKEDVQGIVQKGFDDGWEVRNHLKACGYKIKIEP